MYFYKTIKSPLTRLKSKSKGRSNGRITVAHRSGAYNFLSAVTFDKRNYWDEIAVIISLSSSTVKPGLAYCVYESGLSGIILKPKELKNNDFIVSSISPLPPNVGNSMPIGFIPVGSRVHNLLNIARSSGTSIQILRHRLELTLCKLPSREIKWFPSFNFATIGILENAERKFKPLTKAGQAVRYGLRPTVRGTAMNPIDHPHGGGQGKTSGGRSSVSPYAKLTKGFKTNRKKKVNKYLFKKRNV